MESVDFKTADDYRVLSRKILDLANQDMTRIDYLHDILKLFLNFSRSDKVELWLNKVNKFVSCKFERTPEYSFQYDNHPIIESEDGTIFPALKSRKFIDIIKIKVIQGKSDISLPFFTQRGSFWTNDIDKSQNLWSEYDNRNYNFAADVYKSVALINLKLENKHVGVLQLCYKQGDVFSESMISSYERVAYTLGNALINQRSQAALRERVKELTCLYRIGQIERQNNSIDDILRSIVEFLPPAWQYPEIAAARITLDGKDYLTPGYQPDCQKQSSDIIVKSKKRGAVEVVYTEKKVELHEGPFLSEERNLIDTIALQIGLIIDRKEAEEDKSQLQEQLRHADRLATIGQLAAGVAHELNEPLSSVLGFAQLIQKDAALPQQVNRDIDKIVNASKHAREIIKKLMLFSRQAPAQTSLISLNKVVEESLYFFEARCANAGIELVRSLTPHIPQITGDQAQLNQVLINLVVNSIQAMPDGGKLVIETDCDDKYAFLIVADTGSGIEAETVEKIFTPFFTTKDINEGTGLGLAVVHGIVTSHKGIIEVKSEVGKGTKFIIKFPVE